jgi:hypothetical protein
MIDQTSQFFAMLTNIGVAKQANADALGIAWKITQMGVGDANGTDPIPSATQRTLISEWRRAPLNQLKVDPNNLAIIIAEQVIPADVGGKWIREIGLYDSDGDLVAVANCAPSFKPLLNQGSGRTQVVRMNMQVSNASNIELKIDPSVVLATRAYVDGKVQEEINKLDSKQSVRAATTVDIVLSGLQAIDGIVLAVGDRVLVKNQATAKDNGLYIAAAGVWGRAADADSNDEVTSALLVSVEQGATLAETRWQLVTDGVIVLGTTALTFQNVTQGFAPIIAPVLVDPIGNTPPRFDNSKALATTEFVQRALGSFSGYAGITASRSLTADDVGKALWPTVGALTLTLPTPASLGLNGGMAFTLFSTGAAITLVPGAGAYIQSVSGSSVGSFVIKPGQSVTFIVAASNTWQPVASTADLKGNADFAASFASPGYQRLPSGLIKQWGFAATDAAGKINVTYPVAFPNQMRSISVIHYGTIALMSCVMSETPTGCTILLQDKNGASYAGWYAYWRAEGY